MSYSPTESDLQPAVTPAKAKHTAADSSQDTREDSRNLEKAKPALEEAKNAGQRQPKVQAKKAVATT